MQYFKFSQISGINWKMAHGKAGISSCLLLLHLLSFHFLIPALCQIDPRDQNAVANTFYLTSNSDCRDDLKNIFNNEAVVKGYDLENIGTGPTSCTIRITSSNLYPGVQLQINIIAMNILECRTQLSIYEGQDGQLLRSFDCHSNQNNNRRLFSTSGDTVTFILSRRNPDDYNFHIEIRVKPLRSGLDPDYDRGNYFGFQKFDQDAIIGMIGGFYALVMIICIGVFGYFVVKYNGLDKKWETHQLATMKSATTFDTRSQVSQPPWSVGTVGQRGPNSQYSRTFTETYSRRGAGAMSEDGSSVVYDHDEKFQQRNLMNQRERRNGRDKMASQNSVYSEDDQEDPDNFKEKVITPRVKTGWKPKNQRPPSFEEATRDSSAEESSENDEDETEEESTDNDSTRKRLTTSSEEEDSETETETETESDFSSGGSSRGARARKTKGKKGKEKSKPRRRRRQSSTDDASSQRTEPRVKQRHPQPQAGVPYNPYPAMGGQFVPVMAGPPPQFQPVPMVAPNYPPPQYPVETSFPPASQGQVKPTDPPVYSYLVRRGYTPLEENNRGNSPAASVSSGQRPGPAYRDEPDTPLQSGIEYMRR